jgi:epoxyqueuosine reductase
MKSSSLSRYSQLIKETSRDLGFEFCGISKAEYLEEEAPRLESWLKKGYHGQMQYMENHFDKRLDPTLLVPGAKSVISLLYNYYPKTELSNQKKVARYAYGKDYHNVIRKKLRSMAGMLREQIGDFSGRVFVDSAPVLERPWAARSGIGWIGKNTLLINKQRGSFFFLAEMILDIELEYDSPIGDYCGTCTRCMDACPTDAFPKPYELDASKCISYFTIELKDSIPKEMKGKFENWIFGCDICQEVCPWNRFSIPHQEPKFEPLEVMESLDRTEWEELTEEVFHDLFAGSPLKRPGLKGMKRNAGFLNDKNKPT